MSDEWKSTTTQSLPLHATDRLTEVAVDNSGSGVARRGGDGGRKKQAPKLASLLCPTETQAFEWLSASPLIVHSSERARSEGNNDRGSGDSRGKGDTLAVLDIVLSDCSFLLSVVSRPRHSCCYYCSRSLCRAGWPSARPPARPLPSFKSELRVTPAVRSLYV